MKSLIKTGEHANLAKYIPGMLDLLFQGMTENIHTKEQVAQISQNDTENVKFKIMFTNNSYTNRNSMYICFPMKTKITSDKKSDIDTDLTPVNISFVI